MGERAVFLDRDGVINDARRPVNNPDDFVLLPGVGKAVKRLNDAGFHVYVVTNQGGVGLGYMTEEDLRQVHEKMVHELAKDGAVIEDIRYCAHKPQAGCRCRKPEAGMILNLAKQNGIDLTQSVIVGDRDFDMEAGRRAGTRTVFIGPKHGNADATAPDLPHAVELILQGAVFPERQLI
ncbi:D-glycero-alpha-D-manno-heptose-1,7-bisphosphate 7-phosphatase [Effusibacillus dendaii]|uniref:D,D-heptose 1,7-bisphosphate phosphatase n=1 Tax=Effusibacillus dendaii TaxID=2743772 RepID=A0A7I8DID4_9BACL|nr:HAD family hydrolase [Effusibacillus dendaii]BCJ88420.1 histidinol phosphate phosphatase [Effusibacillus dendaii]